MKFGPKIVTDGLVLALDAANPNSYAGSGTAWNDLTPNKNNGTLVNGPTFSEDGGGSIVFDGVNDYVFRNTLVNVGNDFSVFAWVKPGNINIRDGIVGNSYPYSGREGFFMGTATNYAGLTNTFFITVGADSAYYTSANNSITRNIWNYIGGTVVNGGQDIKLYVNGIETSYVGGVLNSGTITYNTNQLYIGGRYSNNLETFTGNIAIAQIYNRVLSSQEILQNYNALKDRFI